MPPAPERIARGEIEALERPIADDAGRPSQPWRAVDTLAAMWRRGTITAEMRLAGEDFRDEFRVAHLDPLHAAALGRLPGMATVEFGRRIELARRRVAEAIRAVGGLTSPGGSCVWHVLGEEQSLRQWAIETGWRRQKVSIHEAAGILRAALGVLAVEKSA